MFRTLPWLCRAGKTIFGSPKTCANSQRRPPIACGGGYGKPAVLIRDVSTQEIYALMWTFRTDSTRRRAIH